MNELEEILRKYFKGDKTIYYHPADAIARDNFIRWEYFQHKRTEILITLGSNDGEVNVRIFTNAEKLELFIKLVIYA